jgi:hypothetical protein
MVCFGSFVCSTNSTPLSTQQDVLSGLTICTIHNNQTTINIFTHSKQLGLLPCAKRQNCPLRLRWIPTNISDKVPKLFFSLQNHAIHKFQSFLTRRLTLPTEEFAVSFANPNTSAPPGPSTETLQIPSILLFER